MSRKENAEHFTFRAFTVGLQRWHARAPRAVLVKAEINHRQAGVYDGAALPELYKITAVSGHTLGRILGGPVYLTPEQYGALPSDALPRAVTLLNLLGWKSGEDL